MFIKRDIFEKIMKRAFFFQKYEFIINIVSLTNIFFHDSWNNLCLLFIYFCYSAIQENVNEENHCVSLAGIIKKYQTLGLGKVWKIKPVVCVIDVLLCLTQHISITLLILV